MRLIILQFVSAAQTFCSTRKSTKQGNKSLNRSRIMRDSDSTGESIPRQWCCQGLAPVGEKCLVVDGKAEIESWSAIQLHFGVKPAFCWPPIQPCGTQAAR